jgi:hypothetical protein
MGVVAVLISRELYKDAFFLFMIALLYLGIIIVPKQPNKNLRKIIMQDANDIEKENFIEYLNYERERRRKLRMESEGNEEPDGVTTIITKEEAEELAALKGTDGKE